MSVIQPVVTFLSGGAAISYSSITYNASGIDWTAKYTTSAGDTDGLITYSLAYADIPGNPVTLVTSGLGSATSDKIATDTEVFVINGRIN